MRLLALSCRNFLSYADLDLDISTVGMAAIVGKNGSGKSSLAIDIPTFTLWGAGRARTLDKFIRRGAEEASTRVTFEAGGSEYIVTRTIYRSGRGNNLTFLRNGTDALAPKANKAQHTVPEIQAEINKVIGLDYESIKAGPLMIQGDSDNLMALGPSKGMELLVGLFGADMYEPISTEAAARKSAYTRDAQAAQAEIDRIKDILDKAPEASAALNKAKYDHANAVHEREQLIAQVATLREKQSVMREQAQHAQTLQQTADMLEQRIVSDQKEYDRILKELSDAHQIKDEPEPVFDDLPTISEDAIERLQVRADELRNGHTKRQVLTGKLPLLEQQLASMESRAAIIETVPCHGEGIYATCRFLVDAQKTDEMDALRSSITAGHAELASLPDDATIEEAQTKVTKARQTVASVTAERTRRESAVAQWRIRVESATKMASSGSDRMTRMEAQIGRDQQLLRRTKEQLKKVDIDPMTVSDIDVQIQQIKTDVTERERMISMVYEPAVRTAQVAMDRIQVAQDELPQRERAEREASGQAKIYGVLAKAFHRDGIPALIVENGVPIIEDRANEILARMPDTYRIRLRTQRETKKGGMSDKLNIVVEADGEERDYELLSGGERFRIDFALRIALARVLTHRSGTSIQTLIIDEGFGSQDDDGIEAMLESLAAVQDEFGLVLVVTHQKPVIDRFQTRIEVSRDAGGSVATLAM